MATIILWPARTAACRVSMRTRGIFFSAATKMCRFDSLTGLGRRIPQYWRHFLFTATIQGNIFWSRKRSINKGADCCCSLPTPTTFPVAWVSLDFAAFSTMVLSLQLEQDPLRYGTGIVFQQIPHKKIRYKTFPQCFAWRPAMLLMRFQYADPDQAY